MVIQVYDPTSNTEEAEVELFYEDLQDLLELTPKKDVLFIVGDWHAKAGTQETLIQMKRKIAAGMFGATGVTAQGIAGEKPHILCRDG